MVEKPPLHPADTVHVFAGEPALPRKNLRVTVNLGVKFAPVKLIVPVPITVVLEGVNVAVPGGVGHGFGVGEGVGFGDGFGLGLGLGGGEYPGGGVDRGVEPGVECGLGECDGDGVTPGVGLEPGLGESGEGSNATPDTTCSGAFAWHPPSQQM